MTDKGASTSSSALGQLKPRTIPEYIQKIRQGETAKWDKDDLLNVIYWWRQVAGVLIGLLVGFGNVTGFMGFITFFTTSLSVTLAIIKSVLGVDAEEYGGISELLFEGLIGSFSSFMITWVLVHSYLQ